MSRSGYTDCDDDYWAVIRWCGAVKSAIRGRAGQAFLKELLQALDAMPVKRLIEQNLESHGEVCALGAVGVRRGVDMSVDPEDFDAVAVIFGIAPALAREIAYQNDEAVGYWVEDTPERRWKRVRAWVVEHII